MKEETTWLMKIIKMEC